MGSSAARCESSSLEVYPERTLPAGRQGRRTRTTIKLFRNEGLFFWPWFYTRRDEKPVLSTAEGSLEVYPERTLPAGRVEGRIQLKIL